MAEVDARKAGAPYSRQTKGRKDKSGGPAVIKLETLSVRAQNLIDLRIAMQQSAKAYQDATAAVAEVTGLNTATVNRYIRARCGSNFRDERDRASQMAFVFEQLGELGEYKAPKEADLLNNEPEKNPVEKRAANDEPTDADPDDDESSHPGNPAPSPAARAGGRGRGR